MINQKGENKINKGKLRKKIMDLIYLKETIIKSFKI